MKVGQPYRHQELPDWSLCGVCAQGFLLKIMPATTLALTARRRISRLVNHPAVQLLTSVFLFNCPSDHKFHTPFQCSSRRSSFGTKAIASSRTTASSTDNNNAASTPLSSPPLENSQLASSAVPSNPPVPPPLPVVSNMDTNSWPASTSVTTARTEDPEPSVRLPYIFLIPLLNSNRFVSVILQI